MQNSFGKLHKDKIMKNFTETTVLYKEDTHYFVHDTQSKTDAMQENNIQAQVMN